MRAAGSGSRVGAAAEVLLVDDDPGTARLIADLLEPRGYRVWHAPDAAGARALIDKACPDVVILEIMLPDESGLLLCSELRARWPAPILLVPATRRLRAKLNTGSGPAPQLLTVRGRGYKLSEPGRAKPGREPDDRQRGPGGRPGAAGTHPPRAGS